MDKKSRWQIYQGDSIHLNSMDIHETNENLWKNKGGTHRDGKP